MHMFYNELIIKQGIIPQKISTNELAWRIDDINAILMWIAENNRVVLGGDVLDAKKEYTYDNWYYNYDYTIPLFSNVNDSITKAKEYISNYITLNGSNYYIVLVLK